MSIIVSQITSNSTVCSTEFQVNNKKYQIPTLHYHDYWFGLVSFWHQAITWTNTDSTLTRSIGNNMKKLLCDIKVNTFQSGKWLKMMTFAMMLAILFHENHVHLGKTLIKHNPSKVVHDPNFHSLCTVLTSVVVFNGLFMTLLEVPSQKWRVMSKYFAKFK